MGVEFFLMKPIILAVIVLYNQNIEQSPSFHQLKKAVNQKYLQLVVYDNSSQRQENLLFKNQHVIYKHDPENPGLAAAYNFALEHIDSNIQYFVTLDQDTKLHEAYFDSLKEVKFTKDIVAAVPMIYDQGKQISPIYATKRINQKVQAIQKSGIIYELLTAVNSGTAFSISFLKEIGGFNKEFPLDFLDHWLFWKIYKSNKGIQVMSVKVTHDLSVLNYKKVTTERYRSILNAENHFYRFYNQSHFQKYRKQLILRALKQFLTVRNREIWRLTIHSYAEIWKV